MDMCFSVEKFASDELLRINKITNEIEACFSVDKYASDELYEATWLKVIKAVGIKNNMLHKIKFYICFDDDTTLQFKPKVGDEYVYIEYIEKIVNYVTNEYKNENSKLFR